MNRSELSRWFARTLAYAECGKPLAAQDSFARLVRELKACGALPAGCSFILGGESQTMPALPSTLSVLSGKTNRRCPNFGDF